jgi:hypothetical protein
MAPLSFLAWCVAGLGAGVLGWGLSSVFGDLLAQTIVVAALTGAALGFLAGVPRAALPSVLAAAGASAIAFVLGGLTVTPLLAWPSAALAIGLSASMLMKRRRAKITASLAAPVLGGFGFLAGAAAVALAGFALNNSRVLSEFMWGGAAGFGLLTLGGLRLMIGWLDHPLSEPNQETS